MRIFFQLDQFAVERMRFSLPSTRNSRTISSLMSLQPLEEKAIHHGARSPVLNAFKYSPRHA